MKESHTKSTSAAWASCCSALVRSAASAGDNDGQRGAHTRDCLQASQSRSIVKAFETYLGRGCSATPDEHPW